jgi:DNA-binding transcriptional MerR regulator
MIEAQCKISEIENIFKIPRSTVRYYLEKDLLTVNRDDDNGYRYYDADNFMDLFWVTYCRNALNFSVKDIYNCQNAELEDGFLPACKSKKDELQSRIAEAQRSIHAIEIIEGMIERVQTDCGKIDIRSMPTIYCYPKKYIFNTKTTIYPASYPSAEYGYVNSEIVFNGLISIIFKEDCHLISDKDLQAKERVIEGGRCIYSVFCSKESLMHPAHFESMLDWAKEHHQEATSPFLISNLFRIRKNEGVFNYYEAYLPLTD